MRSIILIALACSALCVTVAAAPLKLTTSAGVIVGEAQNGLKVFKGIPYAQPPIGKLRWAPPQPMNWSGERQSDQFAKPCLQRTYADGQPNGAGVVGESHEDCLYLNVWAPANAKRAPVMLWLYGGGGTMGGGHIPTYTGEAFARDGVILVTINYRLGAFGGFAHPAITRAAGASEGLANYHLLDAIAALKWMKANAQAFGGDADNIVLFGESAGATMVANLLTSPLAKGLFTKAIVESTGSLPTPATPLARAESLGAEVATTLGLPGADATIEQLRALTAASIIDNPRTGTGLRTIVDGRVKTQSIMDSLAAGTAIDVPTIIGTNSDEGRLSGTQKVASYAMSGAPVWQYFFDYVPTALRSLNPNGAPHAGELPFVFDTLALDRRTSGVSTSEDQAVATVVHSCWVAFAKASKDAQVLTCGNGFTWPARTEHNRQAVAIFQRTTSLGNAADLRSPTNGAKPGRTSRDVE